MINRALMAKRRKLAEFGFASPGEAARQIWDVLEGLSGPFDPEVGSPWTLASEEEPSSRMLNRPVFPGELWAQKSGLDSQTKCDTCYEQDRHGRELQPPHA